MKQAGLRYSHAVLMPLLESLGEWRGSKEKTLSLADTTWATSYISASRYHMNNIHYYLCCPSYLNILITIEIVHMFLMLKFLKNMDKSESHSLFQSLKFSLMQK